MMRTMEYFKMCSDKRHGRSLAFNNFTANFYQCSKQETIGSTVKYFIFPSVAKAIMYYLSSVLNASVLLRGVLFIVRAGGDIIKAEFMHTKRTNCLTKMKIGIHLEELKYCIIITFLLS